jgi:hypothetical protein
MTGMIEVNTNELIGAALDWAVAQVPGALDLIVKMAEYDEPFRLDLRDKTYWLTELTDGNIVSFRPSTNWAQGGPLLDVWAVGFGLVQDRLAPQSTPRRFRAFAYGSEPFQRLASGPTLLVAACRAILRAKFGDTVLVPKGLIQ